MSPSSLLYIPCGFALAIKTANSVDAYGVMASCMPVGPKFADAHHAMFNFLQSSPEVPSALGSLYEALLSKCAGDAESAEA